MNYDKLKGLIYGLAIGDALGVPFEFKERGTFNAIGMVGHGTHNQPAGTWSDDTSMALATLDSLKKCNGVDVKDMRGRFEAWLFQGEYTADGVVFDYGITTYDALVSGDGIDDYYSNGNGSLMRIAPLAFFDVSEAEIREVSAITHAHDISSEACCILVKLLRFLINGGTLQSFLASQVFSYPFHRLDQLEDLASEEIQSTGFVVHTLEAALWCVLRTKSFEEAVLLAVNLGDDADTTAAVTGAVAGVVYGFGSFPSEWVVQLKNKQLVDRILAD